MSVVIYCRVSSKEQIEGTSLDSQETACRDYARTKGMRVLKVFVEQGESAKFADRTQLLHLIEFCRQNKDTVDTLLVWKLDRFARNVADHYSIKTTLLKYGVQIVSVTEPIDSDPTGKLMEGVLASVAQFDNDVRAMRTVQGMRQRIQDGIFPWGPPLGYKSSVANGEKKNLPDLPDEPSFGLLQRAWELLGTGAYTMADVGRLMESWGLSPSRTASFAPQSLYQLFTNPYYKGVIVDPWDGKEYDGKHKPLVTPEAFARVQQVLAKRDRSVPHQRDRQEFPLRGFARCDACHHPVTGAYSRGRSARYPYYVCQAVSCEHRGKSHPTKRIHEEFETFLDSVAPQPIILERLGNRLEEHVQDYQADFVVRKQTRKTRSDELDRELEELIRMRAQHLITDEEFVRQRKTIIHRRVGIDTSASPEKIDVAHVRENFQVIAEPLLKLRETWQTIPTPFRGRFERLVLPTGFVIGQTRTAALGCLFSFFRALAGTESSVVPPTCEFSNRIIPDIQDFWKALNHVEEEKPIPKWRFKLSHRNRPRMR